MIHHLEAIRTLYVTRTGFVFDFILEEYAEKCRKDAEKRERLKKEDEKKIAS